MSTASVTATPDRQRLVEELWTPAKQAAQCSNKLGPRLRVWYKDLVFRHLVDRSVPCQPCFHLSCFILSWFGAGPDRPSPRPRFTAPRFRTRSRTQLNSPYAPAGSFSPCKVIRLNAPPERLNACISSASDATPLRISPFDMMPLSFRTCECSSTLSATSDDAPIKTVICATCSSLTHTRPPDVWISR